jgi:hypothetical protein
MKLSKPYKVVPIFKESLGSGRFQQNQWRSYIQEMTQIMVLELLKLNIKCGKNLNWATLNKLSTVNI